jgi:hypothetical protein
VKLEDVRLEIIRKFPFPFIIFLVNREGQCPQGECIYFFSVIFYAFFAAVPQKTGLSGVPLRSIPSAYAPGTLRAPPIPGFSSSGWLMFYQ